jgi:hypothetical protein
MKQKDNKLTQFKQWVLYNVIGWLLPDLKKSLELLLVDSKDWAEDWGRDYNEYDYVKSAKKILEGLKTNHDNRHRINKPSKKYNALNRRVYK